MVLVLYESGSLQVQIAVRGPGLGVVTLVIVIEMPRSCGLRLGVLGTLVVSRG